MKKAKHISLIFIVAALLALVPLVAFAAAFGVGKATAGDDSADATAERPAVVAFQPEAESPRASMLQPTGAVPSLRSRPRPRVRRRGGGGPAAPRSAPPASSPPPSSPPPSSPPPSSPPPSSPPPSSPPPSSPPPSSPPPIIEG